MLDMSGLTGHRAYSAGTLLLAVGGLTLYQMTSLVLGPGGSRQLHLSLSVPAADADERNESWTPSVTLALGTLAGPAHATSMRVRSSVALAAAITPAVAPVRPVAPQPPVTHPSALPVPPIASRSEPQPGPHQDNEPD